MDKREEVASAFSIWDPLFLVTCTRGFLFPIPLVEGVGILFQHVTAESSAKLSTGGVEARRWCVALDWVMQHAMNKPLR